MTTPWRSSDFDLDVPADLEAGVYANALTVWHTADEFTLDFGTPIEDDPREATASRCASQGPAWRGLRADPHTPLKMTLYEEKYGPIHYPDRRSEDE